MSKKFKNRPFKYFLLLTIILSFSLFAFHLALAGDPLSKFPGEDLEANDVIKIMVGLSCWLIRVVSVLAFIFVILAGLRFMAAQGNPTKYTEAVKNFQQVLIGVLVIYGVYVIIATVAHAVGITGFSFIPLVC